MDILLELEKLAAAFPWDRVSIEIHREPAGEIRFALYIPCNEACGFYDGVFAGGTSLPETVDRMIKDNADKRDPGKLKDQAIASLQKKIDLLRATCFDFPPYVPNRELAQFVKPTLDV